LLTSDIPQPSSVLPETSTNTTLGVLSQQTFTPEDRMILYAALQDIANELRRIHREHKKHQAQREQQ
jgi:hypothetical protein